MTSSEITIADLEQLLRDQGFAAGSRLGNSRRFHHKGAGAMILLPLAPPARTVRVYVGTVRTHLDRFGLLEGEDFDEWMWRLRIARIDAGKREDPVNGSGSGNGSRQTPGKSTGRKKKDLAALVPGASTKARSSPGSRPGAKGRT